MITCVVVDDEKLILEEHVYEFTRKGLEVIGAYTDPFEAFYFIMEKKPQVAFLDIDLPGMNGISLALRLQEVMPDILRKYLLQPTHSLL